MEAVRIHVANIVVRQDITPKSAEISLTSHSRPMSLQNLQSATTSMVTIPSSQPATPSMVTIPQADYEQLLQSQAIDSAAMSAHFSTPTPGISTNTVMLASRDNSWIIDSDVSSHMSGTSTILIVFLPSLTCLLLPLLTGIHALCLGKGWFKPLPRSDWTMFYMFLNFLSTYCLLVLSQVTSNAM